MAEHPQRDPLHADAARRDPTVDADAGDTDGDTAVDRVVNDVREGVDRVAEKVKGLLRSHR